MFFQEDNMAKYLRVKCSCGEVQNAYPGNVCSNCRQPLRIPEDALLMLYRKGSPYGIAGGLGIYIDGEPLGHIGNKELLRIPLNYGPHNLHIAVGMSRRCNDYKFVLTPENRFAYAKVWIKPGFWTNSFVIEPATFEEMPQD